MRGPVAWILLAAMVPVSSRASPGPADEVSVRVGTPVEGILRADATAFEAFGPSARVSFLAPSTDVFTIEVSSFDFDAHATVLGPDGGVIEEDDDYGIASNASIWLDAEAGTTYTIVVTASGEGDVGGSRGTGAAPRTGAFTVSVHEGEVDVDPDEARRLAAAFHEEAARRAEARGDLRAARAHHEERARSLEAAERWTDAAASLEAALATYPSGSPDGDGSIDRDRLREELDLRKRAGWILLFEVRDFGRARAHYERMRALAERLGDRPNLALAHKNLANVLERLGEPRDAVDHALASIAIYGELRQTADVAEARNELGLARFAMGEFEAARAEHEAYLEFVRETIPGSEDEARATVNLWRDLHELGELERAAPLLERHLQLARELGMVEEETRAYLHAGLVHENLGDFATARDRYALCRELSIERGFPGLALDAGTNLGNVHMALADHDRARGFFEEALAGSRRVGDAQAEANALLNLGYLEERTGNLETARQQTLRSLGISLERGFGDLEAMALANLAYYLEQQGRWDEARERGEDAYSRALEIGRPDLEALAQEHLARIDRIEGDLESARARADRALEGFESIGSEVATLGPLLVLARIAIAEGDAGRARSLVARAEAVLDRPATRVLDIRETSRMRSHHAAWGAMAADAFTLELARCEDDPDRRARVLDEALRAAGRWKGRALLEGIVEHRQGGRTRESIRLQRARREVLARREAALERVGTLRRIGAPRNEVESEVARVGRLADEAARLVAELREHAPADAELTAPSGLGVGDLREALLRPGTILVEYVEGTRTLHAHVVGDDVHERVDLGLLPEIEPRVAAFVARISAPTTRDDAAAIAREGHALYETLLAPVLAAAGGSVETILVVPSPSVALMPFEALVTAVTGDPSTDGFDAVEYVLDRFEVAYGPSTPVLVELVSWGPRDRAGEVLLLADPLYPSERLLPDAESTTLVAEASPPVRPSILGGPPNRGPRASSLPRLESSRDEGFSIARLLLRHDADLRERSADLLVLEGQRSGSLDASSFDLHVGAAASRERLAGDLRPYAVVHLAAHGYVDPDFPRRTGIALAFGEGDDDEASGYLTVDEVLDLDLDANLVVLSACDTARGAIRDGEGIESMARAFLYAGARGVVASLWQVSDRAATDTMEAFYRAVLDEGIPPARALRTAKLALRHSQDRERGFQRMSPSTSSDDAGTPHGHPYLWAPFVHIGLPR